MFQFCKTSSLFHIGLSVLILLSCDKKIVDPEQQSSGTLELRIQLSESLNKVKMLYQTTFDSLCVTVSAPDMNTIYKSKKIESGRISFSDTIINVPSGNNRSVSICTKDKSGQIIHQDSLGVRTCKISPNESVVINSRLIPVCGSLYIQLEDIPKTVDSVFVKFIAKDSTTWEAHVKREFKIGVSLNKIPHLTQGVLYITGVDSLGNVVVGTSKNMIFNAGKMDIVGVQFESVPGNISIGISLKLPGVTLVNGSFRENDTVYETGKLLITEIMYLADDSEYIEIFNPADTVVRFDTLFIQIDSIYRAFKNVQFEPKTFLVFGRKSLPWVDKVHEVSSALNLLSGGNWLTLREKDSTIIDRVVFTGGSNTLEWPNISGKKSIELDSTAYKANYNNYGRYWHSATSLLDNTVASQYGSPHRK